LSGSANGAARMHCVDSTTAYKEKNGLFGASDLACP